jgi:exopolysaccharide biosynthesis polyprenyl glycosylphosphotransferase
MLKQHKKPLGNTFRFVDVLIILCSFYVAYGLRFGTEGLNILSFPKHYQILFVTFLIAWIYFSKRFELYSSKRLTRFNQEVLDVCKATTICLAIATIPPFFIREYPLSRIFLVYLWVLQTGSLILFRFTFREILKYIRRRGYDFREILIVGRNDRAAQLVKKIEESPELGLRILGFLDAPNGENDVTFSPNYKQMGRLDDLEGILRDQVVDEVFIFLPIKSFYSEIEKILRTCEHVGVEVKIPTDLFSLRLAKSTTSLYGDVPVIGLYTSPKMSWQLLVKRLMDITTSVFMLGLLSPVFVLVSILIKATSKGPVFFKQQRVGYNGRVFNCLKFRTMVDNAEELQKDLLALNEMEGPVFKIKDDPRVTKVGVILRKTSIDELPQMINVLKGDMSLVGPRPPIPGEVDQYDLKDRRRLSMKPGITCLWQVNGRNSVPFEKWMELDRQYIDQWSLWLDFKILVKTIPVVLRASGAS